MEQVKDTLKSIRESIDNENISYNEIFYLQSHQKEVLETGDIILAQWAGLEENYA